MPISSELSTIPFSEPQISVFYDIAKNTASLLYQMSGRFICPGPFDEEKYLRVFNQLAERHPLINYKIIDSEGTPCWQKNETVTALPEDLGIKENIDSDGPGRKCKRFLETPMELTESLYRVGVVKAGDSHELVFKWHHLIADGWSVKVFITEFFGLYSATENSPYVFRKLKRKSYSDFARWSLGWSDSPAGDTSKKFWVNELQNVKAFWELPTHCRESDRTAVEIPVRMNDVKPVKGFTLFEHCLAAYAVLLTSYTDRMDPVVAIPVLGRPGRDYIGTVGHFVNTVPLHLNINPDTTFTELTMMIHKRMQEILPHALYPFNKIVNNLDLLKVSGHQPLTDAYCGIVKMPETGQQEYKLLTFSLGDAPWNLGFNICDDVDAPSGCLHCPASLWDLSEVEEMALFLETCLSRVSQNPDILIKELFSLEPEKKSIYSIRRQVNQHFIEERSRFRKINSDKKVVPPATNTEKKLFQLWKEVLGEEDFGTEDDFFQLGGHSLSATRVMSRIRIEYNQEMPLSLLFRFRTIKELALHIDATGQDEELLQNTRRNVIFQEFQPFKPEKDNIHPLSYSQTRMWFLNQLEPDNAAYNMHAALTIRGSLDIDALSAAYEYLQLRHDILRCTFFQIDGVPFQQVHPEPLDKLEWLDWRKLSLGSALKQASKLIQELAAHPYRLDKGPCSHLITISLSDEQHIISLGMHHIVSDQWTWGIISRDISEAYQAKLENRDVNLPRLILQYQDYARWENLNRESEIMRRGKTYWRQALSDLPVLELPADSQRGQNSSRRGEIFRQVMSEQFTGAVQNLSIKLDLTPFNVYLSAFALVLHRLSGQNDFAVGVPSANRNDIRLEELAGTFVNTLVIRIKIEPDDTFLTLTRRIGETFLTSYEFRNYPFERLVEELHPVRSAGNSPLIQVLFNLVNAPGSLPFEEDLLVEPFFVEPSSSQFELSLNVDSLYSRLAEFVYDPAVFSSDTVKLIAGAWSGILTRALEVPEQLIKNLIFPNEDEYRLVTETWNKTETDYSLEPDLNQLLWRNAERHPDKTAIVSGNKSFSYSDFFRRTARLGKDLDASGITRGEVVALHLERGPALVMAMLAVLSRGATYLPLDPDYPLNRKQYMLTHSRAGAVISEETLLNRDNETLDLFDLTLIRIDKLPKPADITKPVDSDPEAPAYVLYTSGSTGNPKGVVIPRRALRNFLLSMSSKPGCYREDVLLSVTSPSFDISGLEFFLPLLVGATLVLPSRADVTDPAVLRRMIREHKVTFMQATPATWRMLLESGWNEPLRCGLCGGETFPPDLSGPLVQRCREVWNMYGPTETTIWSTIHRVFPVNQPIPVGNPIANTQIFILNSEKKHQPPLCPGDLYIAGEGLALGYHRSPELTEAAFVPIPWDAGKLMYKTGDLARWRSDGSLEFLGRSDNQVKINGHRIELEEIENVLSGFPGIRRACCAVKEAIHGDKRLMAYLVMKRDVLFPEEKELDQYLSAFLPGYMIPSAYGPVNSIPLSPAGKIDRRALPVLKVESQTRFTAPANALEADVLQAWHETFNRDDFGMEADFFDIGGHSLLAVRLIAVIARITGETIPLRMFLSSPTPGGNVRLLLHNQQNDLKLPVPGANPVPGETNIMYPINTNGKRPPLFFIAGVFADESGMYRYLSNLVYHFGPDQPLYLLRPRGLRAEAPLYSSIEEVAADFIDAIKSVSNSGPYYLVGECLGGIHAYETARQLSSAGDRINSLILLDTDYPLSQLQLFRLNLERIIERQKKRKRKLINLWQERSLSFIEKLVFVIEKVFVNFSGQSQAVTPLDRLSNRFLQVEKNYGRLARSYSMPEYIGKVHLIVNAQALSHNPGHNWLKTDGHPRSGPQSVEILPTPGDHITRLTEHGHILGSLIQELIAD